jgi:hypothetical protein
MDTYYWKQFTNSQINISIRVSCELQNNAVLVVDSIVSEN